MKKQILILSALLLVAVAAITWLGFQYYQSEFKASTYLSEKQELSSEFDELSRELMDVEEGFELLGEEFSVQKTQFIQRKKEIQDLQNQVQVLTNKVRLTQKELGEARDLMNNIRQKNSEMVELQLETKNQQLAMEMDDMREDFEESLKQSQLINKRLKKDLAELKTQLSQKVEINSDLEEDIIENLPKIQYASLLPISSLQLIGAKKKQSGAIKETKNDKKVDLFQINFILKNHPFAEAGEKEFFIRILEPQGTVLQSETYDSGTFTGADEQMMKYTLKHTLNYQNRTENVNLNWSQDNPFRAGTYTIQVYQDGYLIGENTTELK